MNHGKNVEAAHPTVVVDDTVPLVNENEESIEYLDEKIIAGWEKASDLACTLVESDSLVISEREAHRIIHLHNHLSDFDKSNCLDFDKRLAKERLLGLF